MVPPSASDPVAKNPTKAIVARPIAFQTKALTKDRMPVSIGDMLLAEIIAQSIGSAAPVENSEYD
jgi:hypothetical protein